MLSPNNSAAYYDLAIIGGGINGVGIAADAAGRGLKVCLIEKDDLAAHTSSASSKLIHGGIRYLEQYDFALVRKALMERQILMTKAPHLIEPLRFVLPLEPNLRPAWLIRAGLYLYDHLAPENSLPHSQAVTFDAQSPLRDSFTQGFSYYDCRVDDSRLVVAIAQGAALLGAEIKTRTQCIGAERQEDGWRLNLQSAPHKHSAVFAKALVNSTGAWAADFFEHVTQMPAQPLRWVKGSHIVVPKLYQEPHAFILQATDKRVIFTLPFQDEFTLIGTTDVDYQGDLDTVSISDAECAYLLQNVGHYFKKQLQPEDICHRFSGIRALWQLEDKASNASRDYQLLLDEEGPPLLSVYGGKLTTYRTLAEDALTKLRTVFPNLGPSWTKTSLLPGAKAEMTAEELRIALLDHHPWLPDAFAKRLSANYGTLAWHVLGDAKGMHDLGIDFGHHLTLREVEYLCQNEWAKTAEDILWRRSKLGLWFTPEQTAQLEAYLASR